MCCDIIISIQGYFTDETGVGLEGNKFLIYGDRDSLEVDPSINVGEMFFIIFALISFWIWVAVSFGVVSTSVRIYMSELIWI